MTSGSPAEGNTRDPWPPWPSTESSQEDCHSHPHGAIRPHSEAQVQAFASEAQADDATRGQGASQRGQMLEVHVSTSSMGEDYSGARVSQRARVTQGCVQVLCRERNLHCVLSNETKPSKFYIATALRNGDIRLYQDFIGRPTVPLQTSPWWISSPGNPNYRLVTATYCSGVIATVFVYVERKNWKRNSNFFLNQQLHFCCHDLTLCVLKPTYWLTNMISELFCVS